ncbi:DUF3717 domain-containing protein [Burkholderia cepacia]|nr:DUF3717 domain-containing protein [Burkholderia cepacia]MBR8426427.1 DUF3717 domain-containing protein [Burkholderia cenocepacia]MBX3827691.1 DUF3717 domain-containing protein [Burkholderia contaminans]EKS9805942.1 DUF3717 domain-containing protein [Burkholderia cepacia]EKS9813490.1 DUF3717 domain-containing protein [Burkholderia cepacia]
MNMLPLAEDLPAPEVAIPPVTITQLEVAINRLRRRPLDVGNYGDAFDAHETQRAHLEVLYRSMVTKRQHAVPLSAIPESARFALHVSGSAQE